jgi:hypothetical protein
MVATMTFDTNDLFNSHEMEEGGLNMWTWSLVSKMFWVQCKSRWHYSRLWQTLYWRSLTSWFSKLSLPLEPMLDPQVSFFFHNSCF